MSADFGQPAPKRRERRRPHVLIYALVGPAVGWALMMLLILTLVRRVEDESDIVSSGGFAVLTLITAYFTGVLPAALTGWASLRFRRWRRPAYVAASTGAGALVSALLALAFRLLAPGGDENSSLRLTGAIGGAAVTGGLSALVCALLTMKRPPRPDQDVAAVFE